MSSRSSCKLSLLKRRTFASTTRRQLTPLALPSRWLSDLRSRLGKCIIFGLKPAQVDEAGAILRVLAREWRELLAGSEGFLVGKRRAGLEGHQVVWGEMVSRFLDRESRWIQWEGHVNNTRYIRYAESGRVIWVQKYAKYHDPAHRKEWEDLCTSRGDGMILRSIKTDFKFPMSWPDRISVYHKLHSPPSSAVDSFTLEVLILSERHQRAVARCVEDIVVYNYQRGRKTSLQPFMLKQFGQTWRAQEEAKMANSAKASELVERVRCLEKISWDREGAVEDTGRS
ncbi:MAG: hypothetical protein Q9199_001018 [Rusavskia elegans]